MIESTEKVSDNIVEIVLGNGTRILVEDGPGDWVKVSNVTSSFKKVQSDLISPDNPKGEMICMGSVALYYGKVSEADEVTKSTPDVHPMCTGVYWGTQTSSTEELNTWIRNSRSEEEPPTEVMGFVLQRYQTRG